MNMKMKRVVSPILVLVIIIISIIMPFHLKQICYEFSTHQQEWSLGAWNAVKIYATIYGIIISILTLILVLLNVLRKRK